MPKILETLIEPHRTPRFVEMFPGDGDAAEAAAGGQPRFFRRHPVGGETVRLECEMRLDLPAEVVVGATG